MAVYASLKAPPRTVYDSSLSGTALDDEWPSLFNQVNGLRVFGTDNVFAAAT